jgi:hypothetical protein
MNWSNKFVILLLLMCLLSNFSRVKDLSLWREKREFHYDRYENNCEYENMGLNSQEALTCSFRGAGKIQWKVMHDTLSLNAFENYFVITTV